MMAAISDDGRFVMADSQDHTITVWDAETGRVLSERKNGKFPFAAAFVKDRQQVAVGYEDGTLSLYPVDSATPIWETKAHQAAIRAVLTDMKRHHVLTVGNDGFVRILRLDDGGVDKEFATDSNSVSSAELSRDSSMLVTIGEGDPKLWSCENGALITTLSGHNAPVTHASFSPDGTQIITGGGEDLTARIWHTRHGLTRKIFTADASRMQRALWLDPTRVITGSRDGAVRWWDLGESTPIAEPAEHHTEAILDLALSPTGKLAASVSHDGGFMLWQTGSGRLLFRLGAHEGPLDEVAFSPDERYVASGARDGSVGVWDTATGNLERKLTAHPANAAVVFASNRALLTGGRDGVIRQWDVGTWTQREVAHSRCGIPRLTLSSNRKRLAWQDCDRLQIATAPDWQGVQHLEGLRTGIFHVEFDAAADRVLVVNASNARVWQISDKEAHVLYSVNASGGSPSFGTFSPDGSRLATAEDDRSVRLWDAASGEPLARFIGHTQKINWLAFSSTGDYLVSASGDGTARVFPASQRELRKLIEARQTALAPTASVHTWNDAWAFGPAK